MKLPAFFENRSSLFWGLVGFTLTITMGYLDYITGYEYSFSFFYLVPVSLAAWYGKVQVSLLISATSALTWLMADIASGNLYSAPIIAIWNACMRLGFFVVVALLLSRLRTALQVAQNLSRIDYNTNAISPRYFYELAEAEISRSQRTSHPLSMAYIDLDNFKAINDQLGHSTGDLVLRQVTRTVRAYTRHNDIFARLGGDEFALLLPECDPFAVQIAIGRIFSHLNSEMQKNQWPVTFSIGVVTFSDIPISVDEMVRLADEAMYTVKNGAKNGIHYALNTSDPHHLAVENVPTSKEFPET